MKEKESLLYLHEDIYSKNEGKEEKGGKVKREN